MRMPGAYLGRGMAILLGFALACRIGGVPHANAQAPARAAPSALGSVELVGDVTGALGVAIGQELRFLKIASVRGGDAGCRRSPCVLIGRDVAEVWDATKKVAAFSASDAAAIPTTAVRVAEWVRAALAGEQAPPVASPPKDARAAATATSPSPASPASQTSPASPAKVAPTRPRPALVESPVHAPARRERPPAAGASWWQARVTAGLSGGALRLTSLATLPMLATHVGIRLGRRGIARATGRFGLEAFASGVDGFGLPSTSRLTISMLEGGFQAYARGRWRGELALGLGGARLVRRSAVDAAAVATRAVTWTPTAAAAAAIGVGRGRLRGLARLSALWLGELATGDEVVALADADIASTARLHAELVAGVEVRWQ